MREIIQMGCLTHDFEGARIYEVPHWFVHDSWCVFCVDSRSNKLVGYAFIEYFWKEDCNKALAQTQSLLLDGVQIEIRISGPITFHEPSIVILMSRLHANDAMSKLIISVFGQLQWVQLIWINLFRLFSTYSSLNECVCLFSRSSKTG